MNTLLELKNVSVLKGGKLILDSVSLTLNHGEHLAIIGPNGSGKTSLIRTLTREYYPAAGEGESYLRIMGRTFWDVSQLRKMLGIVSSELQWICSRPIPVREIVLSGFFSSIGIYFTQNVTPSREEKARRVLDSMDVSGLSDRLMNEISLGEARRVLIARALVHDPRLLILDEPAASLDFQALHTFRESVRKIARSEKSIVLVTHDLRDIIPEIGRVILLKEGKIFRDGKKEAVLTSENLSRIFSLPVRVEEKDGYYQAWS